MPGGGRRIDGYFWHLPALPPATTFRTRGDDFQMCWARVGYGSVIGCPSSSYAGPHEERHAVEAASKSGIGQWLPDYRRDDQYVSQLEPGVHVSGTEEGHVMLRLAALGTVVAFAAAGSAGAVGAAEPPSRSMQTADPRSAVLTGNPQDAHHPAVFVTLPMTNGFADATDDLVEAHGFVRDALGAVETVRLVDRVQDSDAVLTVLGRGTGHVELNAALNGLDRSVIASPVMIRATERYIEAMLAVGSCDEAATNVASRGKSTTCYRKIFVGLGFIDRNVRQGVTRPASNSWKACANALARDVQAWVTQNASRLLVIR